MFGPYLKRPGGRIVNITSAAGPMYLQELKDDDEIKFKLTKPLLLPNGIDDIDTLAHRLSADESPNMKSNSYGPSKALLNAYTILQAKLEPQLIINSCTPGFIATDMTKRFGASATNPPSTGAIPPCWLLMDETTIPNLPTGRYYGSDCVRSPIHCYRGPGEPPYDDEE
jgi:carbonyl reductase 1